MAGGSNVRDWMRKRMMPRKHAAAAGAGARSGGNNNSEASPSEQAQSSSSSSSPWRNKLKLHTTGPLLPSALRWRKPHGNVLAALLRRVAYHLLWLVESVVVVARLLVFFVRFGFRL